MKKITKKVKYSIIGSGIALVGCSSGNIEQKVTELEAGQAYTVDTLITVKDGATAEISQDEIEIDKLGTYTVKFNVDKDGKKTEKSFKYKVVDRTPPTITSIKDAVVVQGEKFNLSDYIKIEDNVKSNLIEQVQLDKEIDTNILGKQEINLTVTDSSGNTTTQQLEVNVIEPRTELIFGNTVSIVTEYAGNEVKFDFTPNKIYFTETIKPTNPTGVYSYFPETEGKLYFVLEATISNTGGNRFSYDVFDPNRLDYNSPLKYSVTFNNEYNFDMYEGNITEITAENINRMPSIDPFETQTWLFWVEVPNNVEEMLYELNIAMNNTQYFIKSN